MENNIQKLLEKNEIEKNYERAVKFYDETIKDKSNFSTIDVSFIASSEIEKNRKDLEKKQLEEIASQSNNSTSENYYYSPQTTGLDEYDIERAVERALKNN